MFPIGACVSKKTYLVVVLPSQRFGAIQSSTEHDICIFTCVSTLQRMCMSMLLHNIRRLYAHVFACFDMRRPNIMYIIYYFIWIYSHNYTFDKFCSGHLNG